ncbi:MAG TPA: hypothetical protein VG650_18080 [Mycobacteriales bacterium]|nr:hypothetical protein [Mycobacteriales bacterium]
MILRRGAALLAAAFCFVLAVPGAGLAGAPPSGSPPVTVLLAIPGLSWADVASMPTLQRFVAGAAVGELSVKTAGGITRCAAGMLAVTAGNRTTSVTGNCRILPSTWPALKAANSHTKYKSTIGLLGTALRQAGVRTIAVGGGAVPLLADEDGQVSAVAGSTAAALSAASQAPRGAVVAEINPRIYYMLAPTVALRIAKDIQTDQWLSQTLGKIPPTATVMVAGISDIASGRANLHFFAVRGPGWTHTELRSSAAGRAPYVQLIDVAPTILTAEHVPVPAAVVGRPMQQSGDRVPAYSRYVDDNRHAFAQRTLGQRTFLTLGIAAIVLMLLTLLPWRGCQVVATWLARALAPAPALVFVMNGLPWWRWGQPVFAVLVVGAALGVAAATGIAARRSAAAALAVPLAVTLGALVLDQLTGAHLQFSAPMGDSPIVAGRFRGIGNLDFSIIATSALLFGGIVGGRLGGRRGVVAAAGIAAVALVVDGAPQLGDDLGGVFSLLPGAIVLVALTKGARITWRRALLAVGSTVAAAVLLALADYSRPATSQTHVGRFVGQLLHGGAGVEVHRKLDAVLATFGPTVGTFVVVIAIGTALAARSRLVRGVDSVPGLRAGAIAATVTAVLGVALNDSGVPIAAMAVVVGLSAVYGAVGGRNDAPTG